MGPTGHQSSIRHVQHLPTCQLHQAQRSKHTGHIGTNDYTTFNGHKMGVFQPSTADFGHTMCNDASIYSYFGPTTGNLFGPQVCRRWTKIVILH